MTAVGYTSGDPQKVDRSGYARGDIVAADAGGVLGAVHVGTDGAVLTADSVQPRGLSYGAGGGGGGGTPSNTVVTETGYGQASTAGVATTYSRGDHTHGSPALGATGATAAAGNDSRITGAVQSSLVTTKGDLLVATGNAALARVGVGAKGRLLVPDAAQAAGVRWAPGMVDPDAAIFGLRAVVMPQYAVTDVLTLGAGTLVLVRVPVLEDDDWSTVGTWVRGAGITATGVNGMALYDSAGNLLQKTGAMDTQFATADSHQEGALAASVPVVGGTAVYVGMLAHFTTSPTVRGRDTTTNMVAVNGVRQSVFLTGQADFPAAVNIGTANLNSGVYYMTVR